MEQRTPNPATVSGVSPVVRRQDIFGTICERDGDRKAMKARASLTSLDSDSQDTLNRYVWCNVTASHRRRGYHQ